MPKVKGRAFPYTEAGMRAAELARKTKGSISDREMKIFLDGMSRAGTARNKPKWKDRSAYGRKK